MLFSERHGYKKIKEIQYESIDLATKNGLWNCILDHVEKARIESSFLFNYPKLEFLLNNLWRDFFKIPADSLRIVSDAIKRLKKLYFNEQQPWHFYFDLIEFIANLYRRNGFDSEYYKFIDSCNHVLEREASCYRFIDGIITPITSKIEIEEIEETLRNADKFHGVREHMRQALILLSDREKPDYRNSIKESISAVESLVKVIVNDPRGGLRDAINQLEKQGFKFHGALKEAFLKLYGYTSDEDGIRHAIFDEVPELKFDDAKYKLVTCSAFCNYLISKIK